MPCVEETEKATEMPRGLLPPHPCLHTSLHFLLSRTSKAESLAIASAPPSPFACGGKLNYSRLQRRAISRSPPRSAGEGQRSRGGLAASSTPQHMPCPPPRALQGGLGDPPPTHLFTAPSRAARSLGEEVMPSDTGMREVMEGG